MSPYLFAAGLVVFAIAVVGLSNVWGRYRVGKWCDAEGYRLVAWRGAWFYEGPRRWRRGESECAYYVEVVDRDGLTRTGYLHFDSRWWPFREKRVVPHWDAAF